MQQKRFEWKYEAKDFAIELKRRAKKAKRKVIVKILPSIKSISGVTNFKKKIIDGEHRMIGTRHFREKRITGYYVSWYYK